MAGVSFPLDLVMPCGLYLVCQAWCQMPFLLRHIAVLNLNLKFCYSYIAILLVSLVNNDTLI